ncbi:MAG TPA: MFS domain-containing histidine kinase [Treponemataceae bacterium]|nr:MFS domain-containing histidine kinase [Treponemataceae bacterium]
MKLPDNLRIRFALWTTALFFLAIILYGAFVFVTMDIFLHESVKNSLRASANQLISTIEYERGTLQVPEHLQDATQGGAQEEIATQSLLDPEGKPLLREGRYAKYLPAVTATPVRPFFRFREPDLYIYTAPIIREGTVLGIVQVAQSTETLEHMLKELLLVLAVSLPLFLLGSAASGYFLATRLLKPIDLMTRTARRFSEEDLSARINLPQTDDELGRLAATFDDMLARIEDSFKRYRQFTADASHELRTPVSVIQAILSVTQRRPRTVDEYSAAMADLGAAANRLEGLVSALMTMSRSDMTGSVPAETVNVTDLLTGSLESLRPLAEEKGLALTSDISAGLVTSGDSDALIHVFINVIDNAIKYTDRGTVTIKAAADEKFIKIEIQDSGIGIEKDELPRIFDRFYRVERSRSANGTGLGLSIARAIVERHRGTIEAESIFGQGTLIRILLKRK